MTDVSPGSYVCMRVDKRDRRVNSNRGIIGVVVHVTVNKGIKVVTEKGLLSFKGKVAIMPPDTYRVLSDFATVSPGIRSLRERVIAGDAPTGPMVSKQEVHLQEYGSWFQHKCMCKEKCGPSCRCVKNKLACGSGCGCRMKGFDCDNGNNSN